MSYEILFKYERHQNSSHRKIWAAAILIVLYVYLRMFFTALKSGLHCEHSVISRTRGIADILDLIRIADDIGIHRVCRI